ncbi:MAG: GNAT family N-acetyltransferase [Thermoanaerobaculia bacterium]
MEIEHDQNHHEFVARNGRGEAKLGYRPKDGGVIDIQHTNVDDDLRGEGVASALVERAFQYARENDLRVIATCTFAKRWAEKHPEWNDVMKE